MQLMSSELYVTEEYDDQTVYMQLINNTESFDFELRFKTFVLPGN